MIKLTKFSFLLSMFFIVCQYVNGQQEVTKFYSNPVIPGDHPDPTLTKVGNHFYTTGSSFNPTPKIYHSTDLIHWEVISQPVSASWSEYGNTPGVGIWGGHMVYYNEKYWHFFGKGGGRIYFVKADQPEGPWSTPEVMNVPSGMFSLGVDNSIFIDDNDRWYMLSKAGQSNNHIVELGDDGQPNGNVIDLTWLNPESEDLPYGWAEGPVMWKYKGYYYYSFAQHLVGSQYVMRSDTLTNEKSEWTIIGTNIFTGTTEDFYAPNHNSPAVMLADSTSWVIAHSYHRDYKAQGRQGILCQVVYDENDFPTILRPTINDRKAPNLPSSGIPWMVPHSDYFNSDVLNPEWSLLGYSPENTYSLTEKPGWLKLSPRSSGFNTVIKNDGEHNFSLITKMEFEPESSADEAGLWIFNGPETHQVKLVSTINSENVKVIAFSFLNNKYEVENTIESAVWLRLIREKHRMSGYYSEDGNHWTQIGSTIIATELDIDQTDFNDFTGNQQGLYTKGKPAYFDLYIYRDAFTPITAGEPAIQYNTSIFPSTSLPNVLISIHNNDWAVYAGVDFGNDEYQKQADSLIAYASCVSDGGVIEVFIDSLTGTKIAEVNISNTGGNFTFENFTAEITEEVTGYHDVYLKFSGTATSDLFRLRTITFVDKDFMTGINDNTLIAANGMNGLSLDVIYPTMLNNSVDIKYSVPDNQNITIKIFDITGKEVASIYEGAHQAGDYINTINMQELNKGIFICRLQSGNYAISKKLISVE